MPLCAPLTEDVHVDVCVVGAGIAGLTTAYLLAGAGKSVVLLDDGPIGGGMTQKTSALGTLNYYASAAETFPWVDERSGSFGRTRVTREPVGVVAAVVAWNVPLFLAANKLGPALLAGCSVVLKPAPEAPLTINMVAEMFA